MKSIFFILIILVVSAKIHAQFVEVISEPIDIVRELMITDKIKIYVEEKIAQWQKKSEFEKTADYANRVNEVNRQKKIKDFTDDAIVYLKGEYQKNISVKNISLGNYDADNESFLITSKDFGTFVLHVASTDAPEFKDGFSSLIYQNADFVIQNNQFVLSHIDAKLKDKTFTYDSNTKVNYGVYDIAYSFDAIKLDIKQDNSVKQNTTQVTSMKVGKSEVDTEIPTNTPISNRYALIIGNEDYNSFQTGLNSEINVDYAINDAVVFKEYMVKTIGVPEKQVKYLKNATYGQMSQGIAWINNLAKIENGNAELIFYYSGHGLPDDATKEPYLIPVDVSGTNVTSGIKLTDVYKKLNEYPAKKVTVFLDACFSGGARNQGLVAMKGVKVKAKESAATGNMVVFTSSSGDESSAVYREKQHGYFTYFLLKKLQESKGKVSYKEMATYLISSVTKETGLISKNQTPTVSYSPTIEGQWEEWLFK